MLQSDREHAQAGDDAGVQPPNLSVVPGDEDLSHVLAMWLALPTHREQRRFLTAHTELLHPPSAALLNELLVQEANDSKEALRLRGALALLEDAQRRGGSAEAIRQTYVDAHGGFALDLPPWLEAVEQQLSELRRAGQPHQTAQAYIDLLRDALVHAQHAPDCTWQSTVGRDTRWSTLQLHPGEAWRLLPLPLIRVCRQPRVSPSSPCPS